MTHNADWLDGLLRTQTALPHDDSMLGWARAVIAEAVRLDMFPTECSVENRTSGAPGENYFAQQSVTFGFLSSPDVLVYIRLQRQHPDIIPYLWCGPCHVPVSDQEVVDCLQWLKADLETATST